MNTVADAYMQQQIGRISFTGRLTNDKGEYLGGCTITEKGTSNAVQSKSDGTFSINVAGASSVLQITYVGYESRDFVVGNTTGSTITLTPSSSSLDQVVVVGYASQKKATVTGAISTVKGSDLVKAPVPNLTAAEWVVYRDCCLFSGADNQAMMKPRLGSGASGPSTMAMPGHWYWWMVWSVPFPGSIRTKWNRSPC
jgi:hypothetical protein